MTVLFGQTGKTIEVKQKWVLMPETVEGLPEEIITKVLSCTYYEGSFGGFISLRTHAEEFKFPVDKSCIQKQQLQHNTPINVQSVVHYKKRLIDPDTGESALNEEGNPIVKSMVACLPL